MIHSLLKVSGEPSKKDMSNKKRSPIVRQTYNKRFESKYGMTRAEFRELSKEDQHALKIKVNK